MNNRGLKQGLFFTGMMLVFNVNAAPGTQALSLTPLTDPYLSIPLNESREVIYKLTNHDNKAHTLSMKPMPGVLQRQGSLKFCASHSPLQPGKSCLLSLAVDGREAAGLQKRGPRLCENAWNWYDEETLASGLCIEPEPLARLSVHTIKAGLATLSVSIENPQLKAGTANQAILTGSQCFSSYAQCALVLFAGTDTTGRLKISNTSNVRVTGIQVTNLPPGVKRVIDKANTKDCALGLAPGKKCELTFSPGTESSIGTQVSITGYHAKPVQAQIDVLKIGDSFGGGVLFSLPKSPAYQILVATPSDSPPSNWTDAKNACILPLFLPDIEILNVLMSSTTCDSGPITFNNCGTYWSASQDPDGGGAFSLDFATKATLSQPIETINNVRCVKEFFLTPP